MTNEKEYKKVSELRVWDKNPRGIKKKDFERLKKQIVDLGAYKPLLATDDGIVIGGNMRLRALMDLGVTNVWVNTITFFEEDKKWRAKINGEVAPKIFESKEQAMLEYALSDNDRAGYWEDESLASILLNNPGINLDEFKVDLGEPLGLKDVIERFAPDLITEDEAPDVSDGEAVSKVGEIYQLGDHRVICGDSTKVEVIEALMAGEKANCVFTDPPYNVNYGNTMKDALRHKVSGANAGKTIMNDHFDDHEGFYNFLRDSLTAMQPFVAGDIYICMSSSELHTLQKAFLEAGGHWSTFIIWVKNTFTIGRSNYQRQYEPILYGWFEKTSHYWSGVRNLSDVYKDEIRQDADGSKWLKVEAGVETDIWEYNKPSKSKEHPTMKPIGLCARGIKNSTKYGEIVSDSFGGSGSTLIACEQLHRKCRMVELDPKYVDVIRKRYAKFIGEENWEEATPKI
jgi:DNA modification methylase